MKLAILALGPLATPGPPDPVEQAQTLALAHAMSGRGHDVEVVLAGGAVDAAADPAGGPAVRRLRAGRSPRKAADAVLAAWQSTPPDVVHAAGLGSGLVACSLAESTAVPVVQDVRAIEGLRWGSTRPGGSAQSFERLATLLCRRATHVVSASQGHARDLRRAGVSASRVSVLPYGPLHHHVPDPEDALAAMGDGRTALRILCPDGLDEDGGAADIIAALPMLAGVTLFIAGGPAPERLGTDRAARRIRGIARTHRVADRVELLGALPADQLAGISRSLELVVTVPRIPTPGLTCLDAMNHGCAVVASWIGGARDAVLPGITGMLVPPGDPRTLARTVHHLLMSPTQLRSYGVAGADRAQLRYGWDQLSTEFERILAQTFA